MNSSEIRAEARKSLAGKWKKAVLIILAFFVITFVMSFVQGLFKSGDKDTALSSIIGICVTVISLPLGYGMLAQFIKLKRGEDVKPFDFIKLGMDSFKRVWCVYGRMMLKLLIPYIILVISITFMAVSVPLATYSEFGIAIPLVAMLILVAVLIYFIPKSFLYVLSFYILYDKPEMTNKQIVEESARLMEGNRMKFFLLSLSFIGWTILAMIPFGLGYLWLTPYMTVATIIFYENLAGISDKTPIVEAPVNENTQTEEVIQTENSDNNDNPIQEN